MIEQDDEVVALLSELVELNKANAARYADATRLFRKNAIISRIVTAILIAFLIAIYFHCV